MAYEFNPVLHRKFLEENSKLLKKFNAEYDVKFKKLLKRWEKAEPKIMAEIVGNFHRERSREGAEAKKQMLNILEDSLFSLKQDFGDSIKTEHQKNIQALEKKRVKFEDRVKESERRYPALKLGLSKDKAKKFNAQERKDRMDDLKRSISHVKIDMLTASDQDKLRKKEFIVEIKNAKKEEENAKKEIRENFRSASPKGLSSKDKEDLKGALTHQENVLAKKLEVINYQQKDSDTNRRQKSDILKEKMRDLQRSYDKEESERRIAISKSQDDNKKAREKAKELAVKKRQEKVLARTQRSAPTQKPISKPAQKLLPEKTARGETKKFLETKKFKLKKPASIESKAKSKPISKTKPSQKLIPEKTSQSKTGKFLETKKFKLKKPTLTTPKAKTKSVPTSKTKDKVVFDWDKPKDKLVFEKRKAKPAQKLLSLKTKEKPAQKLLPEKTVRGETKKFLETKKFELKKPSSPTIKDKIKPVPYGRNSGPDKDGFDIIKVLEEKERIREEKEKVIADKKEKLKKAKEARDFKYFITGIGRKPAKPKKPTILRERKGTSPVPGIVRMSDAHYAKTLGWGAYKKKK